MDITLCIPTRNRPGFILRALRYYQSMNFHGTISIGDSSDEAIAGQVRNSLSQFAKSFDINYHYMPDCNAATALQILIDKAKTAYAAAVGDDDFIVPSGMAKCVDFLNLHPEYVAAHGIGVIVGAYLGGSKSLEYASYYPQPIITEPTAAQRLNSYLANYTVSVFSVHRIEAWRVMFENAKSIADTSFGSELLQCCLSVILGKVKEVEGLYLIRQDHGKRNLLPNWFEWITNENWHSSYTKFRDYLAQVVVRQDGITFMEAKRVVENAFASYLVQCIPGNTPTSQWRILARRIPGARKIWRTMEPLRNKYCLSNLLNSSSAYYNDFMPVYKAITNLPEKN